VVFGFSRTASQARALDCSIRNETFILGGMVLFSTVIVVMDWFGRRQRRRQRNAVTTTKH
jgi:hypothetical protein